MTFWVIVLVVVVGTALAWWSSGRYRIDTSRRSHTGIHHEIGKRQSRDGTRNTATGGGNGTSAGGIGDGF